MKIEEIYKKIIDNLAIGNRGLTRFSAKEMEELEVAYTDALTHRDVPMLEKILCLIEHSSSLHHKFENSLLETLKLDLPDHVLIFALNGARKHIISARFQKGHRLDFHFLEILKNLLHAKSPEVVEWTLRTIEECGNQGVYFLREFDKIKPAPWKWFNPHQRAVREIITLLERRWSHFEKHPS